MLSLTIEEYESYKDQAWCYICKRRFWDTKDKIYHTFGDHCQCTGKYRCVLDNKHGV